MPSLELSKLNFENYKMKRRDFITHTASIAAFAAFSPNDFFVDKKMPLGIQLWSVRDDMAKNPATTLKAISKLGFNYVEGFGYSGGKWFGLTAKEMKKNLAGSGLTMPSSHINITSKVYDKAKNALTDDFKTAVADALIVGQKYLINPWLIDEDRTPEGIKNLCEAMNKAGEYCKGNGIKFGYHNHWFEFEKEVDGATLYEYILKNTDAALVTQEMDMCWATYAKQNPVDWFKKYPGRFELAHMKDVSNIGGDKVSSIVGEGLVDFKAILDNQKLAGLKMLIVELENYRTTPLQDVGVSLKNLKKMMV